MVRQTQERERREREGLEPLPSLLDQLVIAIESRTGAPPQPVSEITGGTSMPGYDDIPLPEPDDLLSPLDDIFSAPIPQQRSTPAPVPVQPVRVPAPTPAAPPPPPPQPFADPLETPEVSSYLNYVPGSNELPPDAVEVMRVWRDVSDGTLIVGIKDNLFASNAEMDAAMQQRFRVLVNELMRIASISLKAAPATPPLPVVREAAAAEKQPDKPAGIAGQIEAILQAKLSQSGRFAGRNIHVIAAPTGGIIIQVDSQNYEGIGEVADPEVQVLLREVVQEWEAQQ